MKINVSRGSVILLLLMGGAIPILAGHPLNKSQRNQDVVPFENPKEAQANQQYMYALSLIERASTLDQGIAALRLAVDLYRALELQEQQAIAELTLADHLLYQNKSEEAEWLLSQVDEEAAPQNMVSWSWVKLYYATGDLYNAQLLMQMLQSYPTDPQTRAEITLLSIKIRDLQGQTIAEEEWLEAKGTAIAAKRQDLFEFYQNELLYPEETSSFLAWLLLSHPAGWSAVMTIDSHHDVDLGLPPPPVPFPNGSTGN